MADRHDNDRWLGMTGAGKRASAYSKEAPKMKQTRNIRAENMDKGMPLTRQRKRKGY